MKNLIFIVVVSSVYTACQGTTTTSKENTAAAGTNTSIAFPYTAGYSSDFSKGNDSNTLSVLSNYKAWENGDMDGLNNTYGDSVTVHFSNGFKWSGTKDSVMYYSKLYRDSMSKVEITMDAFTSLHSNDKNTDWVLVWYKEIDTYKNGKIDSAYYEDDNMVDENRRIVFIDSHKQELKK